MKKLFTLFLLCTAIMIAGCSKEYDDSALNNRIDSLEKRMSALETVMNAYNNNLFIKSVQKTDNGYVITFSDGSTATIANGKDGKDGANGKDGVDGKDGKDGVDGKDGKDGVDGKDGADGKDGLDGDTLIDYIVIGENEVTFVLTDGRTFSIALYSALSIEFDENDLVVMTPNSTHEIHYTVKSLIPDVEIEVVSSADIKAKVVETSATTGTIEVKTDAVIDEYSKVVVFVSNGEKVIMRRFTFEEAQLEVTDNAKKELEQDGGTLTLEYMSNMECEVVISKEGQSWIKPVATRVVERHSISFDIAPNTGMTRSATIELKASELSFVYTITQTGYETSAEAERAALIAFYESTNGDNWTNNTNWCSDKPLGEWYGVTTDSEGNVTYLFLGANQLSGSIPPEIGNLTNLKNLWLADNKLRGSIPAEIWDLKNLEYLSLSNNQLTAGSIPVELGNLTKLQALYLRKNQLSGSIPVWLGNLSNLKSLDLGVNQLTGAIPAELGNLSNLQWLGLSENQLNGSIPVELGNLSNLQVLDLRYNQLIGSIPAELGNLSNLQWLGLSENQLNGSIPESFCNFTNLTYIDISYNKLSGKIPDKVIEMPFFINNITHILNGNNFDYFPVLPAPQFSITTLDGEHIDNSIYAKNKYTVVYVWAKGWWENFTIELVDIYRRYKNHGLGILGYNFFMSEPEAKNYLNGLYITWPNAVGPNEEGSNPTIGHAYPEIDVVDSDGNIVFSTMLGNKSYELEQFIIDKLGEGDTGESDLYESTDYSREGEVIVLQRATKGNGIDIVILGDGFSDRQIAAGDYDNVVNEAYQDLFIEEPYQSFRDMFNVYAITNVSKNEGYQPGGETKFNGYFGDGTFVAGDDAAVIECVLRHNVLDEERMDNALLIVMMNSPRYAGTCWMYYPEEVRADYGCGLSVAYFPIGTNSEGLAQVLHHEACGHGFSKLADEYDYGTTISAEEVYYTKQQQADWGWWKNVDFTGDLSAVRWNYFLSDYRYANDGLGVFEGGLTHSFGVWRPTDNSIMRYNYGGFNAPSREAIYYRIHKLAYGDSWQYNYEDFVKYDEINRKATATRTYTPSVYKPTHPPVIVEKSWRDAK